MWIVAGIVAVVFFASLYRIAALNNDPRQKALAYAIVEAVASSHANSTSLDQLMLNEVFFKKTKELYPEFHLGQRVKKLMHALTMVKPMLSPEDSAQVREIGKQICVAVGARSL